MPATTKVIIFGATGAVGTSLAELLSREKPDWKVHGVSRKADGSSRLEKLSLPNLVMETGDPADKESVLRLTKDADIVVSCIGLHKYQARFWAAQWPGIVENLLEGTVQAGRSRRLVFCDNLYAYGAGHATPISTHTPRVEPSSKSKPAVRSQMRRRFEAHIEKHPGTLSVIGGADFFGPHVTATSFLGDAMTAKIVQGQAPLAIGSASAVHDFCYVPDFAKALFVGCTDSRSLDKFWICPHAIRNKTMSDIANDIAAKAGQKGPVKLTVLPTFVVYLLSPFMDVMWEMIEMLPLWTKDYKIDDSDFIKTFGIEATPYDQAIGELVAFFQQNAAGAEGKK